MPASRKVAAAVNRPADPGIFDHLAAGKAPTTMAEFVPAGVLVAVKSPWQCHEADRHFRTILGRLRKFSKLAQLRQH